MPGETVEEEKDAEDVPDAEVDDTNSDDDLDNWLIVVHIKIKKTKKKYKTIKPKKKIKTTKVKQKIKKQKQKKRYKI